MKSWKTFRKQGKAYPLAHLNPFSLTYTPPENPHGPLKTYAISVGFSHHCFTRSSKPSEILGLDDWYPHRQDRRVFDFNRYQYSQNLPTMFNNIDRQKIWHSGVKNFLIVDIKTVAAPYASYAVYFNLRRGREPGEDLRLFIESAYPRPDNPSQRKRRIRFQVLANHTYHGRPIKTPP